MMVMMMEATMAKTPSQISSIEGPVVFAQAVECAYQGAAYD